MENELVDNIWKMIEMWNESHFGMITPEIVLISSPKYYCEVLRANYGEKIRYIKSDYHYRIEYFEIIGLKVPVIISDEMPKNVEYTLMFKKDYERQEKEKLYMKLNAMYE